MENRDPITQDVRTDPYSEIVPTERVGLGIQGPRGNYERGTLEVVRRDLVVQLSVIQKITETAKQKSHYGGVAQLGEHLPCKQGVMGSNPIISTSRQCRQPKSGKQVRNPSPSHDGTGEKTCGHDGGNRWTNHRAHE